MIRKSTGKLTQNQGWVIVVALSLLVALLRLPSLEQPFQNDCGAIAYHARLIVRGEPLYGIHHPAHHLPAVYYTYALAFLLLGDSTWAVKFLLILWTAVTVYLLYRLGVSMRNEATGVLAAVFYSLLTSHRAMGGTTAEIELFANLPRIAAVLVLLHLTSRYAAAWKFVFVGVLSAVASLFKAVYLSPLAMAGFVLLAELWQNRSKAGVWRATIMRGLWVGVGFSAVLLTVVVYFGLLGLLPRFYLVFVIGQRYVHFRNITSLGPEYLWLYPFFKLAMNNVALLIFSLASPLVMVMNKLRGCHSERSGQPSTVFYVAVWYIPSIVEAGIVRVCFSHYPLLVVPPLALLAAWLLIKICRDVKDQIRVANCFVANALLIILLAIPLFISIRNDFDYYYHYAQYKLGLETYQDFLFYGPPGQHLARVQELADYVREHTSPDDYIYYWSGDVQIYYMADRRCPIDAIWPLQAELTGPYQRIFSPQTRYVVVGESSNLARPDWLYAELAKEYTLETIIKGQEVYRRVD